MKTFSTKYMYDNAWTKKAEELSSQDHRSAQGPYVVQVKNGTLLPEKPGDVPWGIGGCLDEKGDLVNESTVIRAFGGKYEYENADVEYLDETVIYIPIIPKHWGHFLIDVVSRLWIFCDKTYDTAHKKIYYCAWNWGGQGLSGNYLKFLQYLGIADRMILLTKPVRAKEVWIPSYTMSYCDTYDEAYKLPFMHVIAQINQSQAVQGLEPAEKIYFTRTALPTSRLKEIGEKEIEDCMAQNGFRIFSPEKLSLEEQIFYINHCSIMAAMSGTIMHNIVFAGEQTKLYIFNRTCVPNPPQLMLNRLYSNEVYDVDVYQADTLKHPRDYGSGPFWVTVNENMKHFCCDLGMHVPEVDAEKKDFGRQIKYQYALAYYGLLRSRMTKFVYYKLKKLMHR